jgi:hypothetical protein
MPLQYQLDKSFRDSQFHSGSGSEQKNFQFSYKKLKSDHPIHSQSLYWCHYSKKSQLLKSGKLQRRKVTHPGLNNRTWCHWSYGAVITAVGEQYNTKERLQCCVSTYQSVWLAHTTRCPIHRCSSVLKDLSPSFQIKFIFRPYMHNFICNKQDEM